MSFVEIRQDNGPIVLSCIGTNIGATCAAQIAAAVENLCATAKGRASEGLHAIPMESAQSAHLATEAALRTYVTARAEHLRRHLSEILTTLSHWRP